MAFQDIGDAIDDIFTEAPVMISFDDMHFKKPESRLGNPSDLLDEVSVRLITRAIKEAIKSCP